MFVIMETADVFINWMVDHPTVYHPSNHPARPVSFQTVIWFGGWIQDHPLVFWSFPPDGEWIVFSSKNNQHFGQIAQQT